VCDDGEKRALLATGTAESRMESEMEKWVAVLWVPDPEKPRGWREFYVARPKPGAARKLGLQRR